MTNTDMRFGMCIGMRMGKCVATFFFAQLYTRNAEAACACARRMRAQCMYAATLGSRGAGLDGQPGGARFRTVQGPPCPSTGAITA